MAVHFTSLSIPATNQFIAKDFTVFGNVPESECEVIDSGAALVRECYFSLSCSILLYLYFVVPIQQSSLVPLFPSPPQRLIDTASLLCWHKLDRQFLKPKANVILQLTAAASSCSASPGAEVMNSLFVKLAQVGICNPNTR